MAVRWYLRYGSSYRDVEEVLAERGIEVDHVTAGPAHPGQKNRRALKVPTLVPLVIVPLIAGVEEQSDVVA